MVGLIDDLWNIIGRSCMTVTSDTATLSVLAEMEPRFFFLLSDIIFMFSKLLFKLFFIVLKKGRLDRLHPLGYVIMCDVKKFQNETSFLDWIDSRKNEVDWKKFISLYNILQ